MKSIEHSLGVNTLLYCKAVGPVLSMYLFHFCFVTPSFWQVLFHFRYTENLIVAVISSVTNMMINML